MERFSVRKGVFMLAAVGALTLLGLSLMVPVEAASPTTGTGPCYFAGVTLCCEFDRVCNNPEDPNDCHSVCARWVGTSRDGGQSPGECGDILHGMLVEAAHNGCWTRDAQCWRNQNSNAVCLDSGGASVPDPGAGN